MDRSLAKLAAALLLGSSLAACSTFGDSQASKTGSTAPKTAKGNTSSGSMAADLDAQIQKAQAARVQGDYAGATSILSQLMLVTPDDPRIAGEYGKTLVQEGHSKDGVDFLKRAAQLQPGNWTFYSAMGVAYDQQGDYANARLAYNQALAIKPADPAVLNNYMLSRMQANDASGARQLMAQMPAAAKSDPKIAQTVALLASASPAPSPAPQAAKTTAASVASTANGKAAPITVHALPANTIVEQLPASTKPAAAHEATGAPHQLAKTTPASPTPAKTTASKVADTAPANASAKKKPAPSANKTPTLRMTADAASP
ncbi:MAG: tetratricopeptide repeat protein, partial [Rhizomicrobium sp.]